MTLLSPRHIRALATGLALTSLLLLAYAGVRLVELELAQRINTRLATVEGIQVRVAGVRWRPLLGVDLAGVEISRPGEVWARASTVELGLSPEAALAGELKLRRVHLRGLEARWLGAPEVLLVDDDAQVPPPVPADEEPALEDPEVEPAPTPAPAPPPAEVVLGDATPPPPEGVRLAKTLQALVSLEARADATLTAALQRLAPHRVEPLDVVLDDVSIWLTDEAPLLRSDLHLLVSDAGLDLSGVAEVGDGGLDWSSRLVPGEAWSLNTRLAEINLPNPVIALLRSKVPGLWRVSAWPSLSGALTASGRLGGDVTFTADVTADGLGVVEPRVASVPIVPVTVRAGLAGTLRLLGGEVILDRGDLDINGLPVSVVGRGVFVGRERPFDVLMKVEQVPWQVVLEAIPRIVVPVVADFRLGEALDLRVHLAGLLDTPEAWKVDVGGELRPPTVLAGRIPQGVPGYPLDGFEYTPLNPAMATRGFTLGRDHPGWVTVDYVVPYCIDSILLAEDSGFYQHGGFDVEALKGALSENLQEGRTVRGGSTISQQLAKNLYLSGERTLARKLQEALLTLELESRLTKRQILETYINVIEWGPGIYGIGRAAGHFFGRTVDQLSVKQCAYLASIIPGPRKYYLYYLRGSLTERWAQQVGQLVDKLWEYDRITMLQYVRAVSEEVVFRQAEGAGGGGGVRAEGTGPAATGGGAPGAQEPGQAAPAPTEKSRGKRLRGGRASRKAVP